VNDVFVVSILNCFINQCLYLFTKYPRVGLDFSCLFGSGDCNASAGVLCRSVFCKPSFDVGLHLSLQYWRTTNIEVKAACSPNGGSPAKLV